MDIPKITGLIFMKYHSERVPRKNVRKFCGKPLFHWILTSLEESEYVSEIIINTDSEVIADKASNNFDVKIHMRPEYLLDIESNEANQIIDYDISKVDGEYFLQTHSTNPVLESSTIDKAIKNYFKSEDHDSLMSVTPHKKRYYWPNGEGINHDRNELIKTQNLAPIYEENSCIYIFSKSVFNKNKNRIGNNPLLYPINNIESIDIDEESDFLIAESIKKYMLENGNISSK